MDSSVACIDGVSLPNLSDRDSEMVRLIGQYLCDKGFNNAYLQLEKDSGIPLEHRSATKLRGSILEGRWDDAEMALDELAAVIVDPDNIVQIRFLLLEQRFLELLEAGDVMTALMLLRNRITPLQRNTDRVHLLASCLMCVTKEEISTQAGGWSGAQGGSRGYLVDRVQRFVPAHTMLPPARLQSLIEESIRAQIASCTFHNQPSNLPMSLDDVTLLQPHCCYIRDFPIYCVQTLNRRNSDLWYCQFSPDGDLLATAGKEANVDIWSVDPATHTISFQRTFSTNPYIAHLCWSPDSKKLAICVGETQSSMVVLNVTTRRQLCSQRVNDDDIYSAASFFSDSRKLAFGGMKGTIYIIDTEANGAILTLVEGYRVQSMVALTLTPQIELSLQACGMLGAQASDLDACRTVSDLSTPGAPAGDSVGLLSGDNSRIVDSAQPLVTVTDQLLIADSLHRVRVFRFGYTNSNTGNQSPSPRDNGNQGLDYTPHSMSLGQPTPAEQLGVSPLSVAVGGQSGNLATIPLPGTSATTSIEIMSTAVGQPLVAPTSTVGQQVSGPSELNLLSGAGRRSTLGSTSGFALFPFWPQGQIHTPGGSGGPIFLTSTQMELAALGGTSSQTSSTAPVAVSTTTGATLATLYSLSVSSGLAVGSSSVSASGTASTSVDASLQPPSVVPTSQTFTIASTSGEEAGSQETSTQMGVDSATASNSGTASTVTNEASGASANGGSNYTLLQHCTLIRESHPIQSIVLSNSGRRLLVTLNKMGLHMWDLESRAIIQRFWGFKQNLLQICSCINAANEDFVATGSEDGYLHIWNMNCGNRPIHSTMSAIERYPVTCVHWNPTLPGMLASVNDEGEIRIWASAKYTERMVQPMDSS